jgi:hypothetical protein
MWLMAARSTVVVFGVSHWSGARNVLAAYELRLSYLLPIDASLLNLLGKGERKTIFVVGDYRVERSCFARASVMS